MTAKLRIVIADDHLLFIDGLRLMLTKEPDLEVVGTATGGKQLQSLLRDTQVDVVLMDINMPGINGLEVTREINAWNPHVKIIMLSTYGEDYMIQKAREYGARGYLLKTSPREKLVEAIRNVASGETVFPLRKPDHAASFTEDESFVKQFNLTRREMDIIQHIKQGMTTKEMADQLNLSQFTIKTHRKNIASKLGLKNFASMMKFIIDYDI
ncbi:response regulator transcription factor [Imperialibacter roseus]|uniref:Response regulator transcription factor n=1 Tax=Imperialibacter roseus TaxID=1324217 RepID=A0ABZ0II33_9BACT|nr:response regulator transcription factor [Imperialibacter roseus]WOK04699.1 response regulator transcription factor [Imperialibacter roseus]